MNRKWRLSAMREEDEFVLEEAPSQYASSAEPSLGAMDGDV